MVTRLSPRPHLLESLVDGPAKSALIARRTRLHDQLKSSGGHALLASAGRAFGRNYAGNTFPFRAGSHFLYFVGVPLEGAVYLYRDGSHTLYLPTKADDDALWHGATPSDATIGEWLGIAVKPLSSLEEDCRPLGSRLGVLPVQCTATRAELESALGRPVHATLHMGIEADVIAARATIALRLHHDDDAIREMREAGKATRTGHLAAMGVTRPGTTEARICASMEYGFAQHGMGTAYGSIVSVRGEVLHNHDHHLFAEAGDLLLADAGAETARGFAGDVTRTWPVNGRFSSSQRALYEVVLGAQERCVAMVKPGVRYRDIHLTAGRAITEGLVALGILKGNVDELVADGVHALFFPHGIGHLIGLDVHDMEDLGDLAGYADGRVRDTQFGLGYLRLDRDLEPGMAVTIEPGFYQVDAILNDPKLTAQVKGRIDHVRLAQFADVRGIRIEDDVLVTETGHAILSEDIPKSIDAVEAAVGNA